MDHNSLKPRPPGAAWTINLILKVHERPNFTRTFTLFDRALDIVQRHIGPLGLEQDQSQARVQVRITAPQFGGNRDFSREFGEDLTALGVGSAFLALNSGPLAMT